MPNWVTNTLNISGTESEVRQLMSDLSQPVPTHKPNPESKWESIQGEWVMEEDIQFSFWNVIAPDKEIWAEYFTSADNQAPANNWYGWNNANCGTKWDARLEDEPDCGLYTDGTFYVTYHFETAWGAPYPVFIALADKYPTLHFSIEWEEEQGYGAEIETSAEGELTTVREWDIPQSHADYVEQNKEDTCVCTWGDDEDDWFDDCPRAEEDENKVIVVTDLTTVS